jgi:hypothetical protein
MEGKNEMLFRVKLFMLPGLMLICGGCSNSQPRPKITLDKDTVITLQRTDCYAGCSPYKVTITADGTVVFEGSKYANGSKTRRDESPQPLGKQKNSISQEDLQLLVSAFDKVDFFALKDKYTEEKDCPEYGTDAPTEYISIQTNGKSKTVEHYGGCMGSATLRALSDLGLKIDDLANTKHWLR